MKILKLRRTQVGDFAVDSLNKAPPRVIPSRRERQQMRALHVRVLNWASEHLDDDQRERFFDAVRIGHYDNAFDVLMSEFRANSFVTLRERRRWESWLMNFSHGFRP